MIVEKKINRRRMLVLMGQVAGVLSLNPMVGSAQSLFCKFSKDDSFSKIYDCVVIGAGVSGLTLARHLSSRSVAILESSDRLGGRVLTDRMSFSHPVECGAEYVHIDPLLSPLWRELYEYQLKLHTIHKNKSYLYHPEIKSHAIPTIKAVFRWNIYNALRAFNSIKYKGAHDISAEEFLTEYISQSDRVDLDFKRMILSGHLGGPEENISMQGFRADHIAEQLSTKKEYYIREGFGALVDHLGLGLEVHTGQKVRRVEKVGGIFTVQTENGSSFKARTVCYSASVGVLKSGAIEFIPGLPDSKIAAIEHLEMSHHIKIILEFKKRFWPRKMSMLNRPDRGRRVGKTYFVPYVENPSALPMLTALIMGRDAMKISHVDQDQILRDICQDLEECFPDAGDIHSLLNRDQNGTPSIKIINWHENPHTLGGLSYIKKNLSNPLHPFQVRETYANGKETPGLFWAGEGAAIFEQAASVHGAHSSGLAASLEIENYLQQKGSLNKLQLAKIYHQQFGLRNHMDWFSQIERKLTLPYDDENSWSEKFSSLLL